MELWSEFLPLPSTEAFASPVSVQLAQWNRQSQHFRSVNATRLRSKRKSEKKCQRRLGVTVTVPKISGLCRVRIFNTGGAIGALTDNSGYLSADGTRLTTSPSHSKLAIEREHVHHHHTIMDSTYAQQFGSAALLMIDSISEEQIFQRTLQNSPKDAQLGAKVKKAYPLVYIPENIYALTQSDALLKCYLMAHTAAVNEGLTDPRYLTVIDSEDFIRKKMPYVFPSICVNTNPVPLTFKLPALASISFRPSDRIYCLVLSLEVNNQCIARGISPPFRISMRISQFINPEAAQERLRRHTKRKADEVSPPQHLSDYNLTKVFHHIEEKVKSVPGVHLHDLESFLLSQLSYVRVKIEIGREPNAVEEKKAFRFEDILNPDHEDDRRSHTSPRCLSGSGSEDGGHSEAF
ncbi:hypothetical protein PROFUN_00958 [Planoprotostelium fungivorum]|uniref:Uncharacterized protein n=1 Tax=Planoprotostelium fungivorum TaxID=1890364 RepID=A0A2P6N4A3_9EUKA|nr:hypothetical protein PROFUN_00958 [Planoprotostelium fungivorum]